MSNEVKDILNSVSIDKYNDQWLLKLNCEQLDRALYVKVNDVLERLWGKWSGKKKGHLFNYDPTLSIKEYVVSGELPPKNATAYFPTPNEVLDICFSALDLDGYERNLKILEPSAGQGAIIDYTIEWFNKHRKLYDNEELDSQPCIESIDSIELLDLNYKILKSKGYSPFNGDFLKDFNADKKYDLIVMNPPFSVEGLSDCYIDHMYKAYDLLDERGKLLCICPSGFTYRDDKKHKAFREFFSCRKWYAEKLPAQSFKNSGTIIDTWFIELKKDEIGYKALSEQEHCGYKNFWCWLFDLYIDGSMDTKGISNKGSDINLYQHLHKEFNKIDDSNKETKLKELVQEVIELSHKTLDGLPSEFKNDYYELMLRMFEDYKSNQ